MDVYSNLTMFYQIDPHIGGKASGWVTVTARNACMCGCRQVLYYSKVNITSLEMFLKPWMSIRNMSLLQHHQFLPSRSPFQREKNEELCLCIDQKHMIYDSILVIYHSNVNDISYARFMKPRMGIIDGFLLQPQYFLPSKSPFWRKIE